MLRRQPIYGPEGKLLPNDYMADVVVLCDCTSSMLPFFKATKAAIKKCYLTQSRVG
jgi:hypothetical protein